MKCKNCGAEVSENAKFCEFCGSQTDSNSKSGQEVPKKRKTWLWVLGWIFVFPVPLTIIIAKSKKLKPVVKGILIAVLWLFVALIGSATRTGNTTSPHGTKDVSAVPSEVGMEQEDARTAVQEDAKTTVQDDAQSEVKDVAEIPKETEKEEIDNNSVSQAPEKVQDTYEEDDKAEKNDSSISLSKANALTSAKGYLLVGAFSRDGMVKQLEFEGYSSEDAVYAADHCGADWMEQAEKSAKNYLAFTAFSESGLLEQLVYEGFSKEEAEHGVKSAFSSGSAGTDENGVTIGQENALKAAKNYLSFTAFSYTGLIEQLKYEGYSEEDCKYAVDHCGADWNEQAAKCAKNYLDFSAFSRQELLDQLLYEGFTSSQAEYGVEAVGY